MGLRTSDGRLPLDDIGPENLPSVFHHLAAAGPMSRSIDDLTLMLSVLDDTTSPPVSDDLSRPLRIAVSTSLLDVKPDDDTHRLLKKLTDGLISDGHIVESASPSVDWEKAFRVWGVIVGNEYQRAVPSFFKSMIGSALLDAYLLYFKLGRGPLTRAFREGFRANASAYQEALDFRTRCRRVAGDFFNSHDL